MGESHIVSRRAVRLIIIWIVFLGIGAGIGIYISQLARRVATSGQIDYLSKPPVVNWPVLIISSALMVGLIVAGYLLERKANA